MAIGSLSMNGMKFFLALFSFLFISIYPLYAKDQNPQSQKQILRFGVFSYLGVEQTKKKYQPIVDYLNQKLENEQVILEVLDQNEIDKRISDGTLDIVTTNPTHFLSARKQQPLTGVIATLVNSEDGVPTHMLGGAIVARADRGDIRGLYDLKQKSIAIRGFQNLGGFRAQAYELYKIGVNIRKDAKEFNTMNSHQEVIKSVLRGESEIGFVKNGIIEGMIKKGELNATDIKIINKKTHKNFSDVVSTGLYPEWPVFAMPHVNEESIRHIATSLFAIEPDSATAKEAKIYGYTIPADYLGVEELSRALRLPPFENVSEFTWKDVVVKYKEFILLLIVAGLTITVLAIILAGTLKKSKKEEKFKHLLLSSLGDGVYGIDVQGRCTFINKQALDMLGFNQDEVLGMDQHALFHYHRMDGSHYHVDECPIYKTTTDGDIRDVEDMFIRKDGTFFDVHLKITPIIVSDKIEGAVVVFQDITQTKALQKDIQEMNQNLKNMVAVETEKRVEQEKLLIRQSKMAMMGEMIGAIAHQWRQPLNALGLIVQDIRVAKEFDELDDGYINDFEKNAMSQIHFMSTTIDDFRNFFKPVKATTDFAIEDAVDKTLKIVNPQLKSHAIQTDFRYTSKHTVHGYQSELEQSIMIIISNAQDALIENNIEEPRIDISISTFEEGYVVLSIEDNGGGISDEIMDRIFEPYFTTKAEGKGTGIGLYMAKEIVESQMGGRLSVINTGTGARFEIALKSVC